MRFTEAMTGSDASGTAANVLVVDDEVYIRDLVSSALRIAGMAPHAVGDGPAALRAAEEMSPDLIVLDVGLPGIDGFEVCRTLRDSGNSVPVIFLTARDSRDDLLQGFTRGGDDYLTKPFSLDELVARARAVLRRSAAAQIDRPTTTLTYLDLELDESAMRVTRGGAPISLSPTEFKLLRFLLRHREQVVSKHQILEHVWEYDFEGNASVVENYISYLRRKIDTVEPKLLHTVRGFGYVLRSEP